MRPLWIVLALAAALSGQDRKLEFNRDVRPILSDKCFACHAADAKAKGIPLRLDIEAEAKKDLGRGRRAIVPGDPQNSRVIQRITADNKALRMPPAHTGMTVTAEEAETLKAWIAQGAPWQKHWAFIPPAKTPGVNTIDAFIQARLAKSGLKPSPPAARETLIRRASLDLTGLPPTPAELDAFLADKSPNAYDKLLDRLLASPRYGEHMAAQWLDAARYADTNGYQFDGERVMWRWRDYVIDSYNANKPYDKFILEQIAGDMLPNATFEQRLATGFNRNHRGNTEDGIVAEEYAVEYVVDRVETTSAVFLGLTMGCARCHNHKYDPFTQKEFYQFFAYFNNVPELGRAMKYGNSHPVMPAPTKAQQAALATLDHKIAIEEKWLAARESKIAAARAAWEKTLAGPAHWIPKAKQDAAFPFDESSADGRIGKAKLFDGATTIPSKDGAQFDIEDRWSASAWIHGEGTVFARNGKDDFKNKGISLHVRDGKLFFAVTSVWDTDALRVESKSKLAPNQWHHVAVTYTGSRMADGVRLYVDGKSVEFDILSDTLYRPFKNAGGKFVATLQIGGGGGKENRFKGLLDDVRLYGRILQPNEIEMLAVGQTLAQIAATPRAQRTKPAQRQLELAYLESAAAPEIKAAWSSLTALYDERERFTRTFPTVMVMAEASPRKPTHLLIRGAYDKPGDTVEPGLPEALPPLPNGAPNNRLGFAQWLVDRGNPLTARVAVNRVWQSIFGTGLVKTAEDFGQQGEWPSHPELLDHLAVTFMESGWNLKQLQKQILLSNTYRQSSKATPEHIAKDPDNRLLARGPRFRMSAEMVRDAALLSAGLLAEKIGGPSVMPYQPDGLWKEVIMQDMYYVQSKGKDLYRRSLYTFWKRTAAPPMMMNFDASQREACTVRESRTNTPLQALNLMNDVTFLEAARFIGQRMLLEAPPSRDARLTHGFRIVLARAPSPKELDVLRGSLAYHDDLYATKPEEAKRYIAIGDTPPAPNLEPRELASYMAVASLLLNTDEAVTKE